MFYENFDRICRERGTSASAAALAIGKAKNTASAWKRNGTIPKEDELIALAKHLRCRVADFFVEDGHMQFSSREEAEDFWQYLDEINPLSSASCAPQLSENEEELLGIYARCNRRQRALLMACVYEFAENEGVEVDF